MIDHGKLREDLLRLFEVALPGVRKNLRIAGEALARAQEALFEAREQAAEAAPDREMGPMAYRQYLETATAKEAAAAAVAETRWSLVKRDQDAVSTAVSAAQSLLRDLAAEEEEHRGYRGAGGSA